MAHRTRALALAGVAVVTALHLGASPQPQAAAAKRPIYITLQDGLLKVDAKRGTAKHIVIANDGANFIVIFDRGRWPIEVKPPLTGWWTVLNNVVFKSTTYGVRGIDVSAGDGDDILSSYGSSMPTRMYGGSGDDVLYGGTGKDTLVGGSGGDKLYARGSAGDLLSGGEGNDGLYGGEGPDWLKGGAGIDSSDGKGGTDQCEAEHEIFCEAELSLNPNPNPVPPPDIPFSRSPD
ncbi:hypothetical protein ACF08N_35935 [Streptomyces sp. NPDC015127]|uniref:hypothetical protein n=1 Tax=Streptomyces sp. NPDC015127 TaxID=3364939 RepID=UPI0036FA4CFA